MLYFIKPSMDEAPQIHLPQESQETAQASLELLYHISRELATVLELHTVLERIVYLSMQTTGAISGSIIVMDDSGRPMESAIIAGAGPFTGFSAAAATGGATGEATGGAAGREVAAAGAGAAGFGGGGGITAACATVLAADAGWGAVSGRCGITRSNAIPTAAAEA